MIVKGTAKRGLLKGATESLPEGKNHQVKGITFPSGKSKKTATNV